MRINNQASAGVAMAPASTMKQMYKSKRLREKEAQLAAECEEEYRVERLLSGIAEPASE